MKAAETQFSAAVVFEIAGTKYSVDTPNPRNCVVARDAWTEAEELTIEAVDYHLALLRKRGVQISLLQASTEVD